MKGRKNMIDWNRNGTIDPVDIGISISMGFLDSSDSCELLGYTFIPVQELEPNRDEQEKIRQYLPHALYEKRQTTKLHRYGIGPFCRFSISRSWRGVSGVYALFNSSNLLYIGQCVDLAQRFNTGYGIISPRNCYIGGQQTNCKINAMILREYLAGGKVYLFFHETNDFDRMEHELINRFQPPFNGRQITE